MFAHIYFEVIEKQTLLKKIYCFFNPPIYINKIPIILLNNSYIEIKIIIEKHEPYKKTFRKIKKASKQMKAYNIKGILIDKNCKFYQDIKDLGYEIFNPINFFKKNIIKIIKFLSIFENKSKKESICVIHDKNLENLNFDFLSKLVTICHTIGIISQEIKYTNKLIDELYEKKGIPIVLLQDLDMLKKADFVISFDDTHTLLNSFKIRNSYIIASDLLLNAKDCYNHTLITGFLLKPYNKININVPTGISQMDFFGAIDEYYDTDLILNLEISNIITNKSSAEP